MSNVMMSSGVSTCEKKFYRQKVSANFIWGEVRK